MQGVSFRSTYAIPQGRSQKPVLPHYQEFISETYPLRKKGEPSIYDGTKKEQYITIGDDSNKINDMTFEKLAKIYNIRIKKLSPQEVEKIKFSKGGINGAELTKTFISEAIAKGAKNITKSTNGIKTVVLFDEDGKSVFGIYKFDEKNNNKLIQEYAYLNGTLDSIGYYNEQGNKNRITFIHDKKRAFEINAKILKTIY